MYLAQPVNEASCIDPERLEFVRRYSSDPLHYSTLQRGLSYFDTSDGFIAYKKVLGHKIALSPEISTPSSHNPILSEFIRRYSQVILCNLDENAACEVHDLSPHFQFAPMGSEYVVDISNLRNETSTARNKLIKGALKHARKHEFHIEEFVPRREPLATVAKVVDISNAYVRASKIGVEMSFVNRPLDIYRMESARYFKLCNRIGLFGVAVIDPYRTPAGEAGYLLNILRFSPTRQWGVYIAVVSALSEYLRKENVKELSLGMAPLDTKDLPGDLPQDRSLSQLVDGLYTKRYQLFLSESLENIKRNLADVRKPRYMAIRTRWLLLGLAALMKSMDVSILKSIVKNF